MSTLMRMLLICLLLGVVSCGDDSDLLDSYIAKEPKVLAVKIQDPEVRPGESIRMQILVGGRDIDQNMDNPVSWYIDDHPPIFLGTSAYNQEFIGQLPEDALNGEQWFDLPILARIQVGQKYLNAQKIVRVTNNPKGKNPVISGVQMAYLLEGQSKTNRALNGEQKVLPGSVKNIALTVLTDELAPGENEQLVYRWYVSTSKNSNGKLYVNNDTDDIEALLGKGTKASEIKVSVVFSTRGENSDASVQYGDYDIYVVVRDNAIDSTSSSEDRFGTDFLYFTLRLSE